MLNENMFIETMSMLCDLYNKQVSESVFTLYHNIFKDYTIEQFNKAVEKCVKNRPYNTLPKPAEILEYLEGTQDDKATVAWGEVNDAVNRGGYYKSIEFSDAITAACIEEMGGWMQLCCVLEKNWCFSEKQFKDLYRLFLKRGVVENKRLLGHIEAKSSIEGREVEIKPLRIGFNDKQITGRDDD